MRLTKSLLLNIILALVVVTLVLTLSQKGLLKRLELASLDFSFFLRGPAFYNPRIIIIEITDSDITRIGRWPWKRSWLAAIAKTLSDLGAKYTYFDIILSEASTEEDDALLQEALKVTKNVYLPFVFQESSFEIKNAFLPLERFSSYLKGTGAVNIYPDIDGTIRRIPLVFLEKEKTYPHIALKIAMDYLGLKPEEIKHRSLLLSNSHKRIKIPLIEDNKMLINWSGKWKDTFRHYSFLDVLAGYQDFIEKKKTKINLNDFKNSICLVGVTAIGLYDIKPIPLQPEYPSIGIVATTLSNILEKRLLYISPTWVNILILYLLALMPAFLIFGEKPLRETFYVILVGCIYFVINFLLFKMGVVLNLSSPILGLFTSYFTIETYNSVRVSVERKTFFKMSVTDGLTGLHNIRYFKMLLKTEIMLTRAEPDRKFSIIMSDVDNFKNFNDTYGHLVGDLVLKEVANILINSVRSSDIVARYGGEEMVIFCRNCPLNYSLIIAEKIRKNVEGCVIKDRYKTYKVTISLGVSTFRNSDDVDMVINRADQGLYKAKESGRNCVCTVEKPA